MEPKEPSAREENSARESDGAANRYKISYDTDNGFSIIIERDDSEIESAEATEANSYQSSEKTTNTTEADLLAQEIMAHWTRWIGIFTALGLMALVMTLLITQQANAAAWAAVDVTREIGRAQTRAYLHLDSVQISLEPEFLVLSVAAKNFGETAARDVEAVCKISVIRKGVERIGPFWHNLDMTAMPPKDGCVATDYVSNIPFPKSEYGDNFEDVLDISIDVWVFGYDVFGKEIRDYGHKTLERRNIKTWAQMNKMSSFIDAFLQGRQTLDPSEHDKHRGKKRKSP